MQPTSQLIESTLAPDFIPTPEQLSSKVLEKLAEPSPYLEGINLPVVGFEKQITNLIAFNSGTVIEAETGAGKSLAVPFIADKVAKALGLPGITVVTQPRNLATRQGAESMAGIAHCQVGEKVGYHVGDQNKRESPETDILTMTERILVNEWVRGDRILSRYSIAIVDEAHEGGKETNNVLLVLKKANAERERRGMEPIRIVITSATIPAKKFTNYLSYNEANPSKKEKVGHIEIPGRTHKVEISHTRRELKDGEDYTMPAAQLTLRKIREFDAAHDDGNILVFMPGKGECDDTIEQLKRLLGPEADNYEIWPAYSELPQGEYDKVFVPGTKRRIVVATNILETSVTPPRLAYVVDTGLIREIRYSPKTGIEKLVAVEHSQSGVTQRAGRAGRVRPGKCDRLFTNANYRKRSKYSTPELLRTHLGPTILELAGLGIRDIRNVRLLDQPNPEDLEHDLRDLKILGAMDVNENLTPEGELMAKIGGKPEHARMLVEANKHGCVKSAAVAIAFADMTKSVMDFSRDAEEQKGIRRAQHPLLNLASDYLTFVKIWEEFEGNGKTEEWAHSHHLDYEVLRRVSSSLNDIAKSLRGTKIPMVNDSRFNSAPPEEFAEAVGKSLAAGLVGTLMKRSGGNKFSRVYFRPPGVDKDEVQIDRSSNVRQAGVRLDDYLVAELDSYEDKKVKGKVNITAKQCQAVPREWIPEIAPQLCEVRELYTPTDRSGKTAIKTRAVMLKGTNDVLRVLGEETLEGNATKRSLAHRVSTGADPFPPTRQNINTIRQANSIWKIGANILKKIFG